MHYMTDEEKIEKLERDLMEAAAFINVLNVEFVLAGYPGGDREQSLANLRQALKDLAALRKTLRDAGSELPSPYGKHDSIGASAVKIYDKAAAIIAAKNDLLNRCVSAFGQHVNSEDGLDSDDANELSEAIQKGFALSGKTTDWHRLIHIYDRLCATISVDNGDEIDVLPLIEKRIADDAIKIDRLTTILSALGEHPETDIDIVLDGIGRMRSEARRSADYDAELKKLRSEFATLKGAAK